MHLAKPFQTKLALRKRENAREQGCTWADNRLLFSRCRCEYSHQWTLSICAHAGIPANGVCGKRQHFFFVSETEEMSHIWIAIWKLAATLLSAQTSRWHKGSAQRCKLAGRSVHRVSSGGWMIRGQERFTSASRAFISSHDWTRWRCPPPGCFCRFAAPN